jgi:hypothetical protein
MSLVLIHRDKALFTSSDEGQTVQEADASRRFLHLMPKLLLDDNQAYLLGRGKAKLQVTSQTPGLDVGPLGGVKVRRPFPNKRYQVGGSKFTRYGWLVALPKDLQEARVKFSWSVLLGEEQGPSTVHHHLALRFKGTANAKFSDVYTMELSIWPASKEKRPWFGKLAPLSFSPYATLDAEDLQAARKVWRDKDSAKDEHVFYEVLEMPALSMAAIWDFQALGQSHTFD